MFEYRKESFTRKDFHRIILEFDKNLVLKEIDTVFDEINSMGKKTIPFAALSKVLDDINQFDDPMCNLSKNSLIKSVILGGDSQKEGETL